MIHAWRNALRIALPEHYVARIDERVTVIEYPEGKEPRFEPDVAVERLDVPAGPSRSSKTGVALLEPIVIPMPKEEIRETYIKILHYPNHELVAVLEVLSTTNKEESGRSAYRAKRNELLNQSIHLVELDLLIGGQRLPLKTKYPVGHYFALVARADCRLDSHVYPWTVRDPLPTIPIPLLAEDGDVHIDLSQVYETTLTFGAYHKSIDYRRPLKTRFHDRDSIWIKERAELVIR